MAAEHAEKLKLLMTTCDNALASVGNIKKTLTSFQTLAIFLANPNECNNGRLLDLMNLLFNCISEFVIHSEVLVDKLSGDDAITQNRICKKLVQIIEVVRQNDGETSEDSAQTDDDIKVKKEEVAHDENTTSSPRKTPAEAFKEIGREEETEEHEIDYGDIQLKIEIKEIKPEPQEIGTEVIEIKDTDDEKEEEFSEMEDFCLQLSDDNLSIKSESNNSETETKYVKQENPLRNTPPILDGPFLTQTAINSRTFYGLRESKSPKICLACLEHCEKEKKQKTKKRNRRSCSKETAKKRRGRKHY